jgi:hypothetical protein
LGILANVKKQDKAKKEVEGEGKKERKSLLIGKEEIKMSF